MPSGETSLLHNPEQLFRASLELVPKLNPKAYSFNTILTKATFAHHLGIATGDLNDDLRPKVADRQSAFMARSGITGLLINSSDIELAERYRRMVATTPVLAAIEEWSFPTYTRDSRPNVDFSLPGSLLLRRTAAEILREINFDSEAYLFYLCTTYIPLALNRDQTFGLQIQGLSKALSSRAETCSDPTVRRACLKLVQQLREVQ